MEPLQHLDIRETARIMGRTTDAIRALIAKGQLPSVRVGGRRYVLARDIDSFLLGQLTTPSSK
jgi:excisionase family DNA binding protein